MRDVDHTGGYDGREGVQPTNEKLDDYNDILKENLYYFFRLS